MPSAGFLLLQAPDKDYFERELKSGLWSGDWYKFPLLRSAFGSSPKSEAAYTKMVHSCIADRCEHVSAELDRHLASLMIGEAVVSRYIDPCGLIVPLGCEPFLWHPLIATVLGWPAALVMLLLMVLFAGTARLIGGRSERKIRGRDLKRRGEK